MNDRATRDRIARDNLGLVWHCAIKYQRYVGGVVDDLIGAGFQGLMVAAERFDESRGIKFSTFAWPWIRNRILEYVRKNHVVHVPSQLQIGKMGRTLEVSIDGDEHFHRRDLYNERRGEPVADPNEAIDQRRTVQLVRDAVLTLPPREREVIVRRFGMVGVPFATFQTIADDIGLSRERVRQIQNIALGRLRKRLAA